MPAALDKSYDGIIVGAGHHGLVLGSYLAKCGLDGDGDMFVRYDCSVRILDGKALKAIFDQITLVADEVYRDIKPYLTTD